MKKSLVKMAACMVLNGLTLAAYACGPHAPKIAHGWYVGLGGSINTIDESFSSVLPNGAVDKYVDHKLMKFSMDDRYITVHSNLSVDQFKHYIQQRVNYIGQDQLASYRVTTFGNNGYFTCQYQFFATKNHSLKASDTVSYLSTAAKVMAI